MDANINSKQRAISMQIPAYLIDEIDSIANVCGIIKDNIISQSLAASFKSSQSATNQLSKLRITGNLNLLFSSEEFLKKSTVQLEESVYQQLKKISKATGKTLAFETAYHLVSHGFCTEEVMH